jgi:thiazole tautomerase (transcriptional regulator TenI)
VIPPLHVVTDDGVLERHDFVDTAVALLERAGRRMALHLRGPATPGRRLHRLAWDVRAGASDAVVLVNDRIDVALTADVSGVQLGQRSLSVAEARALLGDTALVGASVHDAGEASMPRVAGADFYVAGHVFETPSHPGTVGRGPGLIRSIQARVQAPVVAIGGISPDRVEVLVEAGASGVAVLSGIWRSGDPLGALDGFLESLEGGRPAASSRAPWTDDE